MAPEVLIAIISAVGGIVCAVITWLQVVRIGRLTASTELALARIKAESEISLERLKSESDRQRKLGDQVIADARPLEDSLAVAWQEIQAIKEQIDLLTSTNRQDPDLAIAALQPIVDSFVSGYAKWGSQVPTAACTAWHSAKTGALAILGLLKLGETGEKEKPRYRKQLARLLRRTRLQLTDQQMVLASVRAGLRETLTMKKVNRQ